MTMTAHNSQIAPGMEDAMAAMMATKMLVEGEIADPDYFAFLSETLGPEDIDSHSIVVSAAVSLATAAVNRVVRAANTPEVTVELMTSEVALHPPFSIDQAFNDGLSLIRIRLHQMEGRLELKDYLSQLNLFVAEYNAVTALWVVGFTALSYLMSAATMSEDENFDAYFQRFALALHSTSA